MVAQTNKYRPGFYEWFHFNLSIAIDQIYKWQKFCVAKPSSFFSRISVEKTFNFLNMYKQKTVAFNLKKQQKKSNSKNINPDFFLISEKCTKIWKNLSLVLTLLSKSQNKWDIF